MAKKHQLIAYKNNRLVCFADCEIKQLDPLTKNQMKIVTLSATKVNSEDEPHKYYEMSFKEFAKLANVNKDDYTAIYKQVRKLTRLGVDVKDKDGTLIMFKWMQDVKIKDGIIQYRLNDTLLEYYKITKTTKKFSKIHLLDYMPLQSKYSVQLYEFLCKWQNAGQVKQTVEQIREQLQLKKTTYSRPYDFYVNCLKNPLEEINENAKNAFTVIAEYEYGDKKTVKAVTFHIKKIKSDPAPITPPPEEPPTPEKTEKPKPKSISTKKFKKGYEALQNTEPHPDQISLI